MLKVTWVRSTIGHTAATRGTVRALGLHRLNDSVEIADTPQNRGMLRRVAFLLQVEERAGADGGANGAAGPRVSGAARRAKGAKEEETK